MLRSTLARHDGYDAYDDDKASEVHIREDEKTCPQRTFALTVREDKQQTHRHTFVS